MKMNNRRHNKCHLLRILKMILWVFILFSCESDRLNLEKRYYNAVYSLDNKKVEELLNLGINVNSCKGENGWIDSNPLNVLTLGFFNTFYRKLRHEDIGTPVNDVKIFNILIDAGANINQRPYVWHRVYLYSNDIFRKSHLSNIEIKDKYDEHLENYIIDSNRLLHAFLSAGADPDMKGHPYPFSSVASETYFTDEEAQEYFSKGSRAINEAIKKGIEWESQVDLLLQYTKLDEKSLIAAEQSNDPIMIKKINELWERQER